MWEWFWTLDRTRRVEHVISPITHVEIAAWAGLAGERLLRWELRALQDMDTTRVVALSDRTPVATEGMHTVIPVHDSGGVKSMMRSFMSAMGKK